MPRLSIIIPVVGNPERLEDTLVSVLENRPPDCQVVVVFNEPYDDPYDLNGEVCFVEAPAKAGLAVCTNFGILACEAPILHVLRCGVEVTPEWVEAAIPHFDDPRVAAVAPMVVEKDNPNRVVTTGLAYGAAGTANYLDRGRSVEKAGRKLRGLRGPDTAAAFYRKSALTQVGRFATEVGDRLAGIDLAMALGEAGYRCVAEPQCRTFADPAALLNQNALCDGCGAERLFWRWAPTTGWLRSLTCHGLLLVGEGTQCLYRPSTLGRLAGRLWGSLQIGGHRRHWQSLRESTDPEPTILRPSQFADAVDSSEADEDRPRLKEAA